jgi:hypothetical protein
MNVLNCALEIAGLVDIATASLSNVDVLPGGQEASVKTMYVRMLLASMGPVPCDSLVPSSPF